MLLICVRRPSNRIITHGKLSTPGSFAEVDDLPHTNGIVKPLHSVIEQQIDNYISEKVTITDAYQFSQYQTIQQIENFMHSKFTSGQEDSRGNPKPFFNITKGKVNIAIRATDIDRKDISIVTATSGLFHCRDRIACDRSRNKLHNWRCRADRHGRVG